MIFQDRITYKAVMLPYLWMPMRNREEQLLFRFFYHFMRIVYCTIMSKRSNDLPPYILSFIIAIRYGDLSLPNISWSLTPNLTLDVWPCHEIKYCSFQPKYKILRGQLWIHLIQNVSLDSVNCEKQKKNCTNMYLFDLPLSLVHSRMHLCFFHLFLAQ